MHRAKMTAAANDEEPIEVVELPKAEPDALRIEATLKFLGGLYSAIRNALAAGRGMIVYPVCTRSPINYSTVLGVLRDDGFEARFVPPPFKEFVVSNLHRR